MIFILHSGFHCILLLFFDCSCFSCLLFRMSFQFILNVIEMYYETSNANDLTL